MNFDTFEKTPRGERPYGILDRHPDGKHLAMQAGSDPLENHVWDMQTNHRAWSPEGAIALAWLRDGTQIVVLQDTATAGTELGDAYVVGDPVFLDAQHIQIRLPVWETRQIEVAESFFRD